MLEADVHFCPRCGTRLTQQERAGRIRPVCPKCDWIFFPDPKVAAGVVVERQGQILLTRRAVSPKRGLWSLPVGFVDAGEDPARAAERECLEETGLRVGVTRLLDVFSGQEHPRGAHIILIYQAEILGGELIPGDDVDQAAFFPPASLPPLAFSTTQKVIDSYLPPVTIHPPLTPPATGGEPKASPPATGGEPRQVPPPAGGERRSR